jgi:hypothetical protein
MRTALAAVNPRAGVVPIAVVVGAVAVATSRWMGAAPWPRASAKAAGVARLA